MNNAVQEAWLVSLATFAIQDGIITKADLVEAYMDCCSICGLDPNEGIIDILEQLISDKYPQGEK